MITRTKTLLEISSPAFDRGGMIPSKYTCDGINISPPLTIGKIPAEAKSLVLVMQDPDAVSGTFDHWLMWNIPPLEGIEENSAPGVQGKNTAGTNGYTGPCPPSGTHHYYFKIYALDRLLDLEKGAGKSELQEAMKGHIVAWGELMGIYKKML
ncbi:MAG: YbhB/YbcL family Raf kinase inhibitor-like protein [Bacteroidota bacterium]